MKTSIITDRCNITPLEASDRDVFVDLYLNDQVREFLGGISEPRKSLIRFQEMLGDKDAMHWSVRLKDSNVFVGLINIDKHHDGIEYEVSYQFMPNHWGKGLAEETVRVVIDHALPVLSRNVILAETQTKNKQSITLLTKLGFKEIDRVERFNEMQSIYEYRV